MSFNGVKIWKKVPDNLKELKKFHQFKKEFTKHLLSIDAWFQQILCTYWLLKYVNPKLEFLATKLIFFHF